MSTELDYSGFLNCFQLDERPYIEKLLKHIAPLDRPRILRAFKDEIIDKGLHAGCCFIALGSATESGDMILTDLRRAWPSQIKLDQCFLSSQFNQIDISKFRTVAFLDDFIGTGEQAIRYFKTLPRNLPKPVKYYHLAGLPDGVDRVRTELKNYFSEFDVITLFPDSAKPAFGSGIFATPEEEMTARAICEQYGLMLRAYEDPKHRKCYPLGFGQTACLFTSAYNTPNNSLPILWSRVYVPWSGAWPSPFPRTHKEESGVIDSVLERRMHEDHRIGALVVEKIAKYQSFMPPLEESHIRTSLTDEKQLPSPLDAYYRNNVAERIRKLQSAGKTVTINRGYSLHAITIDKEQQGDRLGRSHRPNLVFENADYSHQMMFGERINEPRLIDDDGQPISIREFLYRHSEVDFAHFEWGDVQRITIPQRFANVVGLVIQQDLKRPELGRCLICGVRSKAMAVSEAGESKEYWPVTMSCAEGMLRPDDAGGIEGGVPSPFQTASRALQEELGLEFGKQFQMSDLRLLSLSYDSNRCQPVAAFYIELKNIDYEMLEDQWNTRALDNNEARAILPVPVAPKEIEALLLGNYQWGRKRLRMFSNHQQIGLVSVAEHLFGAGLKELNLGKT